MSAQEALVPKTEQAAPPVRDELAPHPACISDEQVLPRPEELELHPAGVHATAAEEPEDEQAADVAWAPPPEEDEEVAADLHPLRAAGGGAHDEVTWHGTGAGAGAQTRDTQEGPRSANIGTEAQATSIGPAKDAADRT